MDCLGIESVELYWLDLHLKVPHRTSYGTDELRPLVVARVICESGEGFGECSAFASPTYSEEYTAGAWAMLCDHLVGRLLDARLDIPSPDPSPDPSPGAAPVRAGWVRAATAVRRALSGIEGHRMAKATLEMAVVDAYLRTGGFSFASALGIDRSVVDVPTGCVVGTRESLVDLLDEVEIQVESGYERVKLKIAPGWDLAPTRAVRDRFPDLSLQVDANGAYTLDDAAHLACFDELSLLCIEQPLPAEDLVGSAALARAISTPVCLDESLTSTARLEEALALRACQVVCVKPGRMGGLAEATSVYDRCVDAGIDLWCGGMLEAGLARAANATLSALPGFTMPGDLGGGDRFVEGDPFGALAVTSGRVPLWHSPGVGPAPSAEELRHRSARTRLIHAR